MRPPLGQHPAHRAIRPLNPVLGIEFSARPERLANGEFHRRSILGMNQRQDARLVELLLARLQAEDAKGLVGPLHPVGVGVPVPHPHPEGLLRQPQSFFAISKILL